jgi:predicted amidohydrolase
MRVAACQLLDVRDDVARTSELIRDYAGRAEQMGADLVCFPECFLQGYFTDIQSVRRLAIDVESLEIDRLLKRVSTVEATLVVGLIERSGTDFFNTALVVQKGTLVSRYRKIHLLDGERSAFCAGERPSVVDIKGVNVGLAICYDLNFAAAIEANVLAGAALIACPCNNMIRRDTAEKLKDKHNSIRCERARESGVWLLTSDVTGQRDGRVSYGPTALIRPDGVVVDQVPLMETGMIVRDIQ